MKKKRSKAEAPTREFCLRHGTIARWPAHPRFLYRWTVQLEWMFQLYWKAWIWQMLLRLRHMLWILWMMRVFKWFLVSRVVIRCWSSCKNRWWRKRGICRRTDSKFLAFSSHCVVLSLLLLYRVVIWTFNSVSHSALLFSLQVTISHNTSYVHERFQQWIQYLSKDYRRNMGSQMWLM